MVLLYPCFSSAKPIEDRSSGVVILVVEGEATTREVSAYMGASRHYTTRLIGPNR